MNTALWVVQIVLAALYVMAGLWKVTGQGPMLEKMMPGLSLTLIHLIGLGEPLAGFALVLPAVTRRWPSVAGWAGALLAAEAAVFVVYHLYQGRLYAGRSHIGLGALGRFCGLGNVAMTEMISVHAYSIRPRKDKRGLNLISDALPFRRLRYGEPNDVLIPRRFVTRSERNPASETRESQSTRGRNSSSTILPSLTV
jgi:putative oxidoreductase